MSSLALYRQLVPAHVAVLDATITTYLALAARRHDAAAWGQVYPEAMVFYAAHLVERTPGLVAGSGGSGEVGPIVSQRDGDLSRTYAQPASSGGGTGGANLLTTRYGELYLELRDSRAAVGPTAVTPWG